MKILFVCTGNICRSPMAEYLLRDAAQKRGISDKLTVASAGVSDEEHGAPIYPPVKRLLESRGVFCADKRARVLTRTDYDRYDLFLGMTARHCAIMRRLFGGDPQGKVVRFLDLSDCPRDVDDPWYTGEFAKAEREIEEGCAALLNRLESGEKIG